jgi:hypothetical protein
MTQQQAKDNSGALFKNDRRETDNHPHMKGKALVNGRWHWVSAWTKTPQAGGDRYQSLAFTEMTDEQAAKYGGHLAGGTAVDDALRRPAPSQRPKPEPAGAPFGGEQEFSLDDIPFAWGGRDQTPL